MLSLLTFLFDLIFTLFQSKRKLFIKISIQQKEIEILKRKCRKKQLFIHYSDRIIPVIFNRIGKIKDSVSIVKPETLLFWQRELIKQFWTYNRSRPVGRLSDSQKINQLILTMKNDNIYWGYKKIQGELMKVGISLDKKTIRNIIDSYRRRGRKNKSVAF